MTKGQTAPVKLLEDPNQNVKGAELKDKQALYSLVVNKGAKYSSVKRFRLQI